ncbi:AAA family ATPase [Pseudenhygromyxa sp. WMMC2535]|uniref:AAA family ATPase n=1 Tax=Pseudenhygromyxa sp. WMMC2535 TaxID=2712867 RepID=UPI00155816B4|nr:AAA family ATPase [Pseudenhygromyxa sp. WMMC2535]NVB37658.1 AAA family ATPase [Pseudenhygromyxa sp. WMMC2535]
MSDAPLQSPTPITIEPLPGGYDRPGARRLLSESKLPAEIHRVVRAPFGHTVLSLRTLDALVEGFDLAQQAGQAIQAALMEDIARTGSLAIPEPTRDQRLFIGAFTTTVLLDQLRVDLATLGPVPKIESDLEADGLEDLLEVPVPELLPRVAKMAASYLQVQAKQKPEAADPKLEVREQWVVSTIHAFAGQLAGAVDRLTHLGRLRPFGVALAKRKVTVGELRFEGFRSRAAGDPVTDLKPIRVEDIVGNSDYVEAGLKLARDVAAFDLEAGSSPKRINPVLFGLGRPGCGKTITAHAIGNYFLDYCRARDIPARFKVIRRTDWASAYQNASANQLVKIFKEEIYGFEGVCGVYWPDIDTAFASRSSGDLRMEEKNNLGAVFGIFDGTLIPKDGKWFMICDANYMQMDEATRSRIAQNPFTVTGPTTPEDYVTMVRDIMLREVRRFIHPEDPRWLGVGEACVKFDLSGRNVESIANNILSHIQDFEYPDEYFQADLDRRREIIDACSRRVGVDEIVARIEKFAEFQVEAEDKAARDRFEREVEEMVRQLNAGRAATERAAAAAKAHIEGQGLGGEG